MNRFQEDNQEINQQTANLGCSGGFMANSDKQEIDENEVDQQISKPEEKDQAESEGYCNLNETEQTAQEEYCNPEKVLNRIGLALSFVTICYLLFQICISKLLKSFAPGVVRSDWFVMAFSAVSVVGIALPLLYYTTRNVPDSKPEKVVKLGAGRFVKIFFICTVAMYMASFLGVLLINVINTLTGREISNSIVDVVNKGNPVLTILYTGIIAPIVEELMFRKILLNKVRRFGDLPAMLITGIAFGLFHLNLAQIFYAAALGIIFAYVTLKTNTIRYSILLHIIINLIGGTVILRLQQLGKTGLIIIVVWMFISMTVGSVLFILNMKKIRLEKAVFPIRKKSVFLFNPGTLLYVAICIFVTILLL